MLENITNITNTIVSFNETNAYIDLIVVFLVCISDFFAKRYLADLKIKNSVKTLIVGTAFTIGYLVVLHFSGTLLKVNLVKYFISYAVATSLNEILIHWLVSLIRKFFKKNNIEVNEEDIYHEDTTTTIKPNTTP